ncbi:AraC family transcriptional regulator [Kribbella deserti]|uniref:AraC family transcriptional regulator n=1 Tax=Kribbella deserti TaxID=1926257 RepID=A0ABV6QM75_9ACTN
MPHTHANFHELMGVTGGRGKHLLGAGKAVPLERGDIVLVRSRDSHSHTGAGSEGLEFVNVSFPSSVWHGFLDLTRTDPTGSWEAAPEPVMWRALVGREEQALGLFETLVERFDELPTTYDLLRFWIDLLPLLAQSGVPERGGDDTTRPAWLVSTCAAMRSEANLRGGVPRMLELANVSPAHLSRSMRSHYQTTPVKFVAALRMEHAAALLRTTSAPVAAIAERCGFASQSYFAKVFAETHFVSPREFRRLAQLPGVPGPG